MELAQLMTRLDNGAIRCDACQWRCELEADQLGRCRVRRGQAEGIELLYHGLVSGATIGPVEDQRLWHFFPDQRMLAIGGWGYAFPADQQRGTYATPPEATEKRRKLDVDRVANVALEQLCRGVVWAYGDPAVSYEYVRDLMQVCRASSRVTALLTSGFFTLEALDSFGHYLDAIGLDLRGFSDNSYQRLAGVREWRGVLVLAERARKHWRCHVEVTTRVHRGVNDNPDELRALVAWVRDTLGDHTPWHVLPGDAGSETAAAVVRARRIGHEGGLQFVYGPEPNQTTRCPGCQMPLISRENGKVTLDYLKNDQCMNCGRQVNVRTSIFKPKG